MLDKESSLPEDWFKKGDDDKQAAGILLEYGGKSGVVAFLVQQMLENYLKKPQRITSWNGIHFLQERSAGKMLRIPIISLWS